MIPQQPFHNVGIGAVIFKDDEHILCVQERHGPLKGSGLWKLPTGSIELDEHIGVGAAREVFEETGIATEFDRLLAIRHRVGSERCDMYFVVSSACMRARSFDLSFDPFTDTILRTYIGCARRRG